MHAINIANFLVKEFPVNNSGFSLNDLFYGKEYSVRIKNK